MKMIRPTHMILTPISEEQIYGQIEFAGRTCYKSEHRMIPGSAPVFCRNMVTSGHEAVLEHANITVKFICDRGISHEIVRHRLAAYCQESTRYCNYSKDQFDGEICVIIPYYLQKGSDGWNAWIDSCLIAEKAYFELLAFGCSPQEARCVLPTCLKTELVMTCNIREWRHFLKLRCGRAAHPQMRELAVPLLKDFKYKLPALFEDIEE